MIKVQHLLGLSVAFCGMLLVLGCGVGKEIKKTGEEIRRSKREVKKRLDELQLRVEMDFELQDAFKLVNSAYQEAWSNGPVSGWDSLSQTNAATSSLGTRISDARKKGIEPIFNIPNDLSDEVKADTVIAYAPGNSPDQFWILLANGKYDKVTSAELAEAKGDTPQQP
jgi:hypothetical protein